MDNKEQQIKDLLNQILVLLHDVKEPEIDKDYETDYGYSNLDVSFISGTEKLSSVKIVLSALLEEFNSDNKWDRPAEKMARAYYSSFCNG